MDTAKMDLVIDGFFKELFNRYFGKESLEQVRTSVNEVFTKWDPELLTDAVNVVKASCTIASTFSECYDRVSEKVLTRIPQGKDIDKFILSVVLKVLIAIDADSLDAFLQRPRNILREVTAKHFRVQETKVTEKMIREMQEASDNFTERSYSITDPPVGSWDEYFYNVCRQVARNSKCMSRRIGAVMVRDNSILSTGYNGPPRGVPRCDLRWKIDPVFMEKYGKYAEGKETSGVCPRRIIGFKSGEGLEICTAGHAERNALINAARHGISTKGTTLYMTCGVPCTPCLVEIINAGISDIVVTSLQIYDENALYLLNQSNLGIRMYDFIS